MNPITLGKWGASFLQSGLLVAIGAFALRLGFWENTLFVLGLVLAFNVHDEFVKLAERARRDRVERQ